MEGPTFIYAPSNKYEYSILLLLSPRTIAHEESLAEMKDELQWHKWRPLAN